MTCEHVNLGNGAFAIICTDRKTRKFCVACGRPASKLCDWKVPDRKSGTCDKPICERHAQQVGPAKDLCPDHQRAYADWKKRREAKGLSTTLPEHAQGDLFAVSEAKP